MTDTLFPHVYALDEIPATVHTELANYFKTVTTDQYGTIDTDTRSFKTRNTDPTDDNLVQMVTVRGNVDADTGEFSLRQVMHTVATRAVGE